MRTTSATSTKSPAEPTRHLAEPLDPAAEPTLRRVPFADLTGDDRAAWAELAERALEPNPFFEAPMLEPAAALHGGGVELGMIERDGKLIGALPLRRAARWRQVPAPALSAWRHADSFLGTPLIAPDDPHGAFAAILDHARYQQAAGLVAFEWLGTGGPVERALREVIAERGLRTTEYGTAERAALYRRSEHTYLDDTVSKGRARELRRLRRKLSEELGAPIEAHDRTGDPAAIEGFLAAEAEGWKGRRGTAFGTRDEYADFFRTVCDGFAASGRLQLLVLSAGDTDVAWKVNFAAGDAVFCFKIAYAEKFARFSPGVQLERDFVDIFHDTGFAWSDSCAAPDNAMINRLWPDRRSLSTLLVFTGGARGAAARGSVRAAIALRQRTRRTREQAA